MNANENPSSDDAVITTMGVAPMRTFTRPLAINTYATTEDWLNAALEGTKRMAIDEEFRKDIEQFIS